MQEAINNKKQFCVKDSSIAESIRLVCKALNDEITANQVDPSRIFEVTDGQKLFKSEDGILYFFKVDIPLPILPETPIHLIIDGREITKGILVSIQDFDVLIQLKDDIGETVPRAKVTSVPWFIFDKLRNKLEDELERKVYDLAVPEALLKLNQIPFRENKKIAQKGEKVLRSLNIKSLIPNESQLEALRFCSGSNLYFVWGPPGTGKTSCLAQLARTLVASGEKVLVMAHANAAVDVAMVRTAKAFTGSKELAEGKVIRIGIIQLQEAIKLKEIQADSIIEKTFPDLVKQRQKLEKRRTKLSELLRTKSASTRDELGKELDEVRKKLNEIKEAFKNALQQLIKKAKVIGSTLSRFAIDDLLWNWYPDTILIDETSMANFPFVLASALRSKTRLILFGDFRQLPPISIAKSSLAKKWLMRDAFEISGIKAQVDNRGISAEGITLLETQYRMSSKIAHVVSDLAYQKNLKTAEGVDKKVYPLSKISPYSGEPLIMVNTFALGSVCFREPKVGSYSRVNPIHSLLAICFAKKALTDNCKNIAIITPYKAQARLLSDTRHLLANNEMVAAATVHRFQGSECDYVIFDLVDSPFEKGASKLTGSDFDTSLRLINVALSRAKGKLIVIANKEFIIKNHPPRSPSRKVVELIKEHGKAYNLKPETLEEYNLSDNLYWESNWSQVQEKLSDDIMYAKKHVHINLYESFNINQKLVSSLRKISSEGLKITLYAPLRVAKKLEDTQVDIRLMTRPTGFFALIDNQIAYIGGYLGKGIFARLEDAYLVEKFSNLLLGKSIYKPPPDAKIEREISDICGRCNQCGEERRPRVDINNRPVLICKYNSHQSKEIDLQILGSLITAMKVQCPQCNAQCVAREKGKSIFIACPNYNSGCGGKLPMIRDLFGGG